MTHLVYRLTSNDLHRYKTHLLSLDEYSRYLRFGYHIKTEIVQDLINNWSKDRDNHIIFAIENEDLDLVGVGHIALSDGPAELAFSVLKEYQGRGMGNELMSRCIEWCQNRGIKTGCMVCLSSNATIKHLAKKHGILVQDGPETMAEVHIPDPSITSVLHEVLENNLSTLDHLGKAQRKFARMAAFPLLFK